MPPDLPSGSRLQHLRALPLILPLLRHWELAGETGERDQDRLPAEQAGILSKMAFVTWRAVIGS